MNAAWAERIADAVRDRCPEAKNVPVDLPRLAKRLGIGAIIYSDLVEDGRLETDGATARILIRESTSTTRQRFTIAHELGHLMLTQPGQSAVERRLSTNNDTERFCDQFAAELLLPRRWVLKNFRDSPHTLDTVRNVARTSATSMAASVVRLQQVLNWDGMLLHWRLTDGTWRFRWGAGVPSDTHGRIRTSPETRDLFDKVSDRTGRDVDVRLPLLIRGQVVRLAATLSCRRTSALALASYPAAPTATSQGSRRRT